MILQQLEQEVYEIANLRQRDVIRGVVDSPCFFQKEKEYYRDLQDEADVLIAGWDYWSMEQAERYLNIISNLDNQCIPGPTPCETCKACRESKRVS